MIYKRIILPRLQTWRWTVQIALIAVFFTLLTVFVADNYVMVETRFVFFGIEMRLAWSLLLAAVLGFSIGILTARLRR